MVIMRALLPFLFFILQPGALSAEDETGFNNDEREGGALFSENDITGSGGGLVLNYGRNFSKDQNHFNWGGRFYFNLKDFLRLGVYGNLIKSMEADSSNGYFVGGMLEPLIYLDPFILGFPIIVGLSNYNDVSYFSLYPQVETELRVTPDFSISLLLGYLILLDGNVFKGERNFWDDAQITVGVALSFG